MALYVNGIGILGPGLAGWAEGRNVLAGEIPYCEAAMPEPSVNMLPPNEQRRSSATVRWALHVAQEAMQQADVTAREVVSIFASSEGETECPGSSLHGARHAAPDDFSHTVPSLRP